MLERKLNQPRTPHEFLTTRWTVVARAARWQPGAKSHQGDERAALESLCAAYWRPLYAFARRRGASHEDTRDDVQGFFAHVLEKGTLAAPAPERGRFRAFLIASFKNHVSDARSRAAAHKRGGGALSVSLDAALESAPAGELAALVDPGDTPERSFARAFAREVLARTLARLEAEQVRAGKGAAFARLRPYLTEVGGDATYAEIARRLATSEGAVKVAVHRLRRRFGELLRDEVRATVADPAEVEDELESLRTALGA